MREVNLIPICSNFLLTSAFTTAEFEGDAGDVFGLGILVESITGGPSAASIAVKFQVSPIEFNGYNVNTGTSATESPWIDVAAAHTGLGNLLVDGDFPASLADQTVTAFQTACERRIRLGSMMRLVRAVITPAFTGGSSPGFRIAAYAAVERSA